MNLRSILVKQLIRFKYMIIFVITLMDTIDNIDGLVNDNDRIISKFQSHPSTNKIKQNFKLNDKFKFRKVTVNEVK